MLEECKRTRIRVGLLNDMKLSHFNRAGRAVTWSQLERFRHHHLFIVSFQLESLTFTQVFHSNMTKTIGAVKWFDPQKGYGFVVPSSSESSSTEEVFVHQTEIRSEGYRTLVSGRQWNFNRENDSRANRYIQFCVFLDKNGSWLK